MNTYYTNNRSTSSLKDNLYDIQISQHRNNKLPLKSQSNCPTPKRVASMTSLPTLNESTTTTSKRPGDYYIHKINSSKTSLPLNCPSNTYTNRYSTDSTLSFQSSITSDDHSSILSSQFDTPIITPTTQESRLSSLTTNSSFIESNTTIKNIPTRSSSSSSLTNIRPQVKPNLKSASTSNVLSKQGTTFAKNRSKSTATIPTISRSKSKFMSLKEAKERQLLRKKKYEENDIDEEILSQDFDNLIFNVPVIKDHNQLYSNSVPDFRTTRANSVSSNGSESTSTSTSLSRMDLVGDNDKYNTMKPCPLPGKLTSVGEENDNTFDDEDSEIINEISNFYTKRSESVSKLIKLSREENLLYKLPNYIKSQSSLDDLHLISPEKLNFVDQSRPINLPPKSTNDKTKHNKEFKLFINNYEHSKRSSTDLKINKQMETKNHNDKWMKYYEQLDQLDSKNFNKKFQYEKNLIRKLTWDSNIPNTILYKFWLMVLNNNSNSQDSINTIENSFKLFESKYEHLSTSMRNNKDEEFKKIVNFTLSKPLFKNLLDSPVSKSDFVQRFNHLLYIKSLSEFGLNKTDETFLIPILLILFPQQSICEVYIVLELINQEILNREFITLLNSQLNEWKSKNQFFGIKYDTVKEFENLDINKLFSIFCQLDDQLPLSLSAPSTPIIPQGGFESLPNQVENDQQDSIDSSSLKLIEKLLTLLIIYSNSIKTKLKNNSKIFQTFSIVLFTYYHINWNDYKQLINENKSIRLNHCSDQQINLESFVNKWKDIFKK